MQDTIAVIFDFDDTLAPDSTSSFLESIGVEVPAFWKDVVQPLLDDGWDPVPAYLYKMIVNSKAQTWGTPITKKQLAAWGRRVKPFNGAATVFSRLRRHLGAQAPGLRLEFYLISSGIGEIIRSTKLAKHFKQIWACEFEYGTAGEIVFPKRIVSFTDKTRYLFCVSKGLIGEKYRNQPFEVNRKIQPDKLNVPLDQMVFVGDGFTDVPCFSLLRKHDGVALGVYDPKNPKRWGRAWGFIEDERVSNLAPAEYGKSASLYHSLIMAIDSLANRIALKRQAYQG